MNLERFHTIFENGCFQFTNPYLNRIMQDFHLIVLTEDYKNEIKINQHKNITNIIVIDIYKGPLFDCKSCDFFIISTDYYIILIQSSIFSILCPFFILNNESIIYCISFDAKLIIQKVFNENSEQIYSHFSDENDDSFINIEIPSFLKKCELSFSKNTNDMKQVQQLFWSITSKCISGFLIKFAYFNSKYDRLKHYEELFKINENKNSQINVKENEYIKLQFLSVGSSSHLYLVFLIKERKICVLKLFIENNDDQKLFKRERNSYLNIHHPLFPRYFGEAEEQSCKCILIEYLENKTLNNINMNDLLIKDKIKIIMEVMIIIEYLHYNDYIYRDLKPNNIIYNKDNRVYLFDFDRMIKNTEIHSLKNDKEFTKDFIHDFVAPEIIKDDTFTKKVDIYSIGKIILYIISEENEFTQEIIKLGKKCTDLDPNERPIITELIDVFYNNFFSKIYKISSNLHQHNKFFFMYWFLITECQNVNIQMKLASLYLNGFYIWKDKQQNIQYSQMKTFNEDEHNIEFQYIHQDISESICYYSLAADQNNIEAQYKLGVIYYEGKYDINKAIHYFTLATNQNHPEAQFYLGFIHHVKTNNKYDINKAIHYYSLAADQNIVEAQIVLGLIYSDGEHIVCNINKAINYFSLAADQNSPKAQYYLGKIYYEGKYVKRDINKDIHYFTLAANQNDPKAQYYLGGIYFEKKYETYDINKAIHYFSLAANQNITQAQCGLGTFYYEGKYVKRDINKAIHYFTLAANQNIPLAQCNLGSIYYEGECITRDINKAIHYFTLAASQNDQQAQLYLGVIFSESQYVKPDINKAIHYYTLSANQNNIKAQYKLGVIYHDGIYVKRNIDKSIYYLTLAANQNDPKAQYNLGVIYYEGQYVTCDINKAIHYFQIAANQNNPEAQLYLGLIYYEGQYVTRDINKAIYYYSLAANQNYSPSQNNLGIIYYKGEYVSRDIDKAIYYLTLAADQNNFHAQFSLAVIYLTSNLVARDIKKALHYLSLSANQNFSYAQFYLFEIYSSGNYVPVDVNKAIYYCTLAANQDNPMAQYSLGFIYYCNTFNTFKTNEIKKGIQYIMLALKNGYKMAYFSYGFLLQEGKNIDRNIDEAIHYYKEASSFNNNYAKNNLGIIYKHGYGDKIKSNIVNSIVYFEEAIRQKKDFLSMYNLAHIYIFDETIKKDINKSIDLLTKSAKFIHSFVLLCLLLVKMYEFNFEAVKVEIMKRVDITNISHQVFKMINNFCSLSNQDFDNLFESYRSNDFVYDIQFNPVLYSDIKCRNKETIPLKYPKAKNISSEFYEAFGIEFL